MARLREMMWDDSAPAIAAPESARAAFIRKTYSHVFGATLAFVALEAAFFATNLPEAIFRAVTIQWFGPLLMLLGLIGAGWLARAWAHGSTSVGTQYLGLGLYVVAEALFFAPWLWYASHFGENVIPMAGFLTLAVFGALTAVVFITGADFSFLRSALSVMSLAALAIIVAGMIFGFSFPLFLCGLLLMLACGYILYDTSNILHHYPTTQYVGASLELFASLALLFWEMIRIVLYVQSLMGDGD